MCLFFRLRCLFVSIPCQIYFDTCFDGVMTICSIYAHHIIYVMYINILCIAAEMPELISWVFSVKATTLVGTQIRKGALRQNVYTHSPLKYYCNNQLLSKLHRYFRSTACIHIPYEYTLSNLRSRHSRQKNSSMFSARTSTFKLTAALSGILCSINTQNRGSLIRNS